MDGFVSAIAALERAISRTIKTCQRIAPEHWTTRPTGRRHAISEVMEHLALSNDLFAGRLEKIIRTDPGQAIYAVLEDEEIPHLFERVDEPPGIAEPTGRWADPEGSVEYFLKSADRVIGLGTLGANLMRVRGAVHPLFGPLDGTQWALFVAAHTERHRSELIGLNAQLTATHAHPNP